MEWMLKPYRQYADFDGRARRKEYWMFFLFQFLVQIALVVIMLGAGALGDFGSILSGLFGLALVVFSLGSIVPGIAVAVRRMHDIDKSGWSLLIGLIPLVGGIILLVFYCTEGTRGPNRFGPDPKDVSGAMAFQ